MSAGNFQDTNESNSYDFANSILETIGNIEPTPIDVQGNVRAVCKMDSLLPGLMSNCDEYIEALSQLIPGSDHMHGVENPQVLTAPVTSSSINLHSSNDKPKAQPQQLFGGFQPLDRSADVDSDDADASLKIHPYQHERWVERYQDLVEFHRVNGHCNVPYCFSADPRLGQWVKRQRHQYKLQSQGLHSNLTQDRIQMLEMLGFIWDSHGAAWDEKYQELKIFRKIHGHCNVPCLYRGNSKLSTWIKRQRRQYRLFMARKPSTMDSERVQKLEDLGLVWDYYGSKGFET